VSLFNFYSELANFHRANPSHKYQDNKTARIKIHVGEKMQPLGVQRELS
jgi:hypothetical protein